MQTTHTHAENANVQAVNVNLYNLEKLIIKRKLIINRSLLKPEMSKIIE